MSADRRPRVLHIVPAMFGDDGVWGGAERYALELARHMSGAVPTRMLTFGDRARCESVGNLEIRVVDKRWHVRGQRLNPVSAAIFREILSADVVHCHQRHVLNSSLSAVFGALVNRKVFVTDLGGGAWDVSAYLNTDDWFCGHLHISEYSRRISGHDDYLRAHVVLGGVDTEKFSPDASVQRGRHVLFVGRLLPHKGVHYLIEAMPPGISLKIVGRPLDEQYYKQMQSVARGKQITFHHDYSDADLIDSYRSALCVVLPSVYRLTKDITTEVPELLGQTLLEGMACGTPAICTNVASMPEIVEDGKTGFVVEPNSAGALREKILWLRNHPSEAAAMGNLARDRVLENFTWTSVVARCLEAYSR